MVDAKQGQSAVTEEAILAQLRTIASEQLEFPAEKVERIQLELPIVNGLDLDSLAQVVVLTQLEDHYGLDLDPEDRERLQGVETVRDLVELVHQLAGEKKALNLELKPKYETIVDALMDRIGCTQFGARFVTRSGEPTFYNYDEVVRRAIDVAAALQANGLRVGDRVAIILSTSIHFLDVFLGTQLAGGTPAPLYPPVRLGKLDEYFLRTGRMLNKISARFLVTEGRLKKIIGSAIDDVDCLEKVFDAKDFSTSMPWQRVEVGPETAAFLQFSSGTTRESKAVVVSHSNLLHNLEMMNGLFRSYNEQETAQGGVCWLPLYHDMGLVGFMFTGLYHPGTVTYMGPEEFVARPRMWLQTLSHYRAVVSAAPNFAYGLCVSRIRDEEMQGVDLSNWRIALNGAEPIDSGVMQRFCDRFSRWGFRPEAMTPVYGLAEAGLGVSFSSPLRPPKVIEFDREVLAEKGQVAVGKGRRLASLGPPLPGVAVEIRGTDNRGLIEGRVGRIVVKGASITCGYFNDPQVTAQTINDGWLDTGDLGFFYEQELYVAGRAKELIIVRGRNYSPQEIEELIGEVEGLRKGCAIALGHVIEGAGEQLVVLAEKDIRSARPESDIEAEIKRRILEGISLVPSVRLLEPGTLPRTSSGKMRRLEALRQLEAESLKPPKRLGVLSIVRRIGQSQLAWCRFWLRRVIRNS